VAGAGLWPEACSRTTLCPGGRSLLAPIRLDPGSTTAVADEPQVPVDPLIQHRRVHLFRPSAFRARLYVRVRRMLFAHWLWRRLSTPRSSETKAALLKSRFPGGNLGASSEVPCLATADLTPDSRLAQPQIPRLHMRKHRKRREHLVDRFCRGRDSPRARLTPQDDPPRQRTIPRPDPTKRKLACPHDADTLTLLGLSAAFL
jgi:hypothetical protein